VVGWRAKIAENQAVSEPIFAIFSNLAPCFGVDIGPALLPVFGRIVVFIPLFVAPLRVLIMAKLSADDLIYGYINGIFPMADDDGTIYWYAPNPRAIIPIDTYKPARSLRPVLNKGLFEVRINTDFEQVMRQCAVPRSADDSIWISEEIVDAYTELHRMGLAHSVETYSDNRLVGGLYGVSLGAVFFGESMFHREPNASKVAFHHLIMILRQQQFDLLDTQFINDNVKRYGAVEIPRDEYLSRLAQAMRRKARFIEPDLEHFFSEERGVKNEE
jgi:leucyl/phenylalanyl-tRNA---protein transferase